MSLVGFRAQNHPQQARKDAVDDRGTDPEFFARMVERFGPFTIDVAAAPHNAKCERYYTIDDDGLVQPWAGERVWCNPPYSDIGAWVRKAWVEFMSPSNPAELIVMLLPANRTEQRWWQEEVEPHRDDRWHPDEVLRVEFLPGRMRFIRPGADSIGPNERPPFGCCLLIWREHHRR
ncbi:MAG: DNA N-6-adenine-methyltransferase [Phycisphaerales bacterium]